MTFEKGLFEGRTFAATKRAGKVRRRRNEFTAWLTSANGDHRFDEYARGFLAGLDRP